MATLDWTTDRRDGVTLVELTVGGLSAPSRVTIRNRLDGPVWPPRREGMATAGWTDRGFEAVLDAETHALGYATPAAPADPPAELVAVESVPDDPAEERLSTPADVIRCLGDPSPPPDAVPVEGAAAQPRKSDSVTSEQTDSLAPEAGKATVPDEVDRWLETIARRVDSAESLAAAESLSAATAAVRAEGGLASVDRLASTAAADERRLRELSRRAESLADRRSEAEVPTETLARLA
ncbi:hypothetical protein [Haloarcula marina]|uniref:DUF7857 domain-containing protein n=1 Tax=Haloarcula marina TaxID=2961574 RepID=UPI0020B6DFBE|nr:hypothetical protein [Halomicroarcula marina]